MDHDLELISRRPGIGDREALPDVPLQLAVQLLEPFPGELVEVGVGDELVDELVDLRHRQPRVIARRYGADHLHFSGAAHDAMVAEPSAPEVCSAVVEWVIGVR